MIVLPFWSETIVPEYDVVVLPAVCWNADVPVSRGAATGIVGGKGKLVWAR